MKVAVTGSTGLIGQALVRRLRSEGHRPVRVIRSDVPPDDLPAVRWDPAAGEIDRHGLEGVDAVVHLAGESIASRRWTEDQKRRIRDSRVDGTSLVSATIATLTDAPEVLISGSAIGIYGDRGSERLTESSSAADDFLATVCRDWEAAADPARSAGVRVVHARTSLVLSESGGALGQLLPFFRLGIGGRIGDGRQWMSWISLEDTVSALMGLLTADVEGPVNVTAPVPVTNGEFTTTLGAVLGRPTFLPSPKLALWARLGRELTEVLLYGSTRVEPQLLESQRFRFAHRTLEDALRAVLDRPR